MYARRGQSKRAHSSITGVKESTDKIFETQREGGGETSKTITNRCRHGSERGIPYWIHATRGELKDAHLEFNKRKGTDRQISNAIG